MASRKPWSIDPSKERLLELLEEVARARPDCRRVRTWHGRVTRVARACGLYPSTLLRAIGSPSPDSPGRDILRQLTARTGVPMLRWLIALDYLTEADAQAALGQEVRAQNDLLGQLTPRVRRMLRLLVRLSQLVPPEVVDAVLDAFEPQAEA